ncbi:DUF397 domain-containing protein [Kitasatospora sp. NPDC086801]|uniref:DUF397 domain-containing protein n=1 Tax=Kitasatospora sp. NPDC086801 TaxID=3364066 RepID=UPI0038045972
MAWFTPAETDELLMVPSIRKRLTGWHSGVTTPSTRCGGSRRRRLPPCGEHGLTRSPQDPGGPALVFPAAAWSSFITAIQRGELPA